MIIVDSHCHLDMLAKQQDIKQILTRANQKRVKYLQTICTKLENIDDILQIAEKYPQIFASVGIHPSEVKEIVTNEQLIGLSQHKKIIAFGETGLDYYYHQDQTQQKNQIISFEQHILAAQQTKLPVIIHMREAEIDSYELIKDHMQNQSFPALIHCFTASEKFAKQMLDLGLYISISGIVTFKNATNLQEIVRYLPLDRILVETDSPYLTPVPYRGKVNEPAHTYHVVEYIAKLKNISTEKFAQISTNNFFRLFTKAQQYIDNNSS